MAEAGKWETRLGQLSSFLAVQEAQRVEIVDEGSYLGVSWEVIDGIRQKCCLRDIDLAYLQRSPKLSRAATLVLPMVLTALGRALDQSSFDVASIVEESDGFLVTGSLDGTYASERYATVDLMGTPEQAPERQSWETPQAASNAMPPVPDSSPLRRRLQQLAS